MLKTVVGTSSNDTDPASSMVRRRRLTLLAAPVILFSASQAAQGRTGQSPAAKAAAAHDRFAVAGTTDAEVRPFLASLQAAVASDDRRAVAKLFFFPSKVWDGKQSITVVRRRDLAEHYEAVFDAGLKQAIAQARVDSLLANWQGVALPGGRLWFARITTQSRLAVTAIPPPGQANG